MEPPVTGYLLFNRDGTYFQLIKQDDARDKWFVSTMPYFHGPSYTAIRMWYQSVTINYTTYGSYVHPYYCFIPETNYPKGFSAGNHIWELPVLRYHQIMVIYPYLFLVVITQLFSYIIFINGCICIITISPVSPSSFFIGLV